GAREAVAVARGQRRLLGFPVLAPAPVGVDDGRASEVAVHEPELHPVVAARTLARAMPGARQRVAVPVTAVVMGVEADELDRPARAVGGAQKDIAPPRVRVGDED